MSQLQRRANNWSDGEKLELSQAVRERYFVLFGELSNTLTKRDKDAAWSEVVTSVNIIGGQNRTLSQVKEKYKDLKKRVKGDVSSNNKEMGKTGGGAPTLKPIDACAENILANISPACISGIIAGIDTSNPGMHLI